jgi:class 3 adenylate cyclase
MSEEAPAAGDRSSAPERRLATILVADVFDYSRLMGEDEERTVRTLREHRAVLADLLKAHKGRIFNTAGDATLAEFPSAIAAVRCATQLQVALRKRNERLPDNQQAWLRVGINLGDVIVQGEDLLGDGVNVVARIQNIAEPGGVCISGSVYDQVRAQLDVPIKALGEKSFKNIAQPVRTFSIADEAGRAPVSVRWRALRKGRFVAAAAGIVGLAIVAATAFWSYRDYGLRAAQDSKRMEVQIPFPPTATTTGIAPNEAQILSEIQAAKDALARAQTSADGAQQSGSAAEAREREAKLRAELSSAQDALEKAADRAKGSGQRPAATAPIANAEVTPAKAPAPAMAQSATTKDVDRFDGTYAGPMCMAHVDNTERCIDVALNVEHGRLSASWPSPWNTNPARAKGSISADGMVELALSGFNARTNEPMPGRMRGGWADDTIKVSGAWLPNSPVTATWTRSGDVAAASERDASTEKGVERFDGVYGGRMCSIVPDGGSHCWNAQITIQNGTLSAAWPTQYSSSLARASGTVSADGAVDVALSGFNPNDGTPLGGTMIGSVVASKVTVAGTWANGAPINATWTAATGRQGSGTYRASVEENPGPGDNSTPPVSRGRHGRR